MLRKNPSAKIIANGILRALATILIIGIVLYFLYEIQTVIVYLCISLILCLISNPLVLFLKNKLKFSNSLAATTTIILFIFLIVGFILLFVPLIISQANNLALLLNEALQSMQNQMQSEMAGSGSCNNPGKGRPKPGQSMSTGDMKEMLKKQLEQMQKGPNPGGKKPGDKPGSQPGMSPGSTGQNMMGLGNKEMAKMAAEQTAISQRLEQLRNEMNKDGKGSGNQLNPLLKELEEQEKNLINKNINKDMINRQQEILTRLLESEKAIMERGYEEKRESKSGKDEENGNKIRFEEYNKSKLKEIELLKSSDPSLKQYYKEKANQYFNLSE